jgi:hypothetical protein
MFTNFLKSPSNRAGLSAWVATVLTALVQYAATRAMPPMSDLLGVVVGLVAILQPDNTVTVTVLERAIADLRLAIETKSAANIESVVNDAVTIAAGVASPHAAR